MFEHRAKRSKSFLVLFFKKELLALLWSLKLDITHLREWIGRTETAEDVVTPRLLREYAATLEMGTLALHWCLAPPAAAGSGLGPDGHPARGGFLPPVPLPRRMWAGGNLALHDRLRAGDAVTRRSRIEDVTLKQGSSGTLCFVTVAHEISTARGLAIAETQDIVYRDIAPPGAAPAPKARTAQWQEEKSAGSVLLFRFSALTFNGHRIHYDRNYAMEQEFYPGLVVHGPLQASWLLDFAARIKAEEPVAFTFRGVHPLFDFQRFRLCAAAADEGLRLWVETDEGVTTMEASARW
jgi:3-methylfumaryl-CoA hydratase